MKPSQSNSQNSPENQTRPNPTPNHNSQKPGKPKQNKPQKPHTTNKSPPCSRHRISRISHTFMRLSRRRGQVTHVLLTRSPLIQDPQKQVPSPFDLHVLSTPPAFVLSQDQTLQTKPTKQAPTNHKHSQPEPKVSTTVQKTRPGPTQPPQQRARQTKTKQNPKNHTQTRAAPRAMA